MGVPRCVTTAGVGGTAGSARSILLRCVILSQPPGSNLPLHLCLFECVSSHALPLDRPLMKVRKCWVAWKAFRNRAGEQRIFGEFSTSCKTYCFLKRRTQTNLHHLGNTCTHHCRRARLLQEQLCVLYLSLWWSKQHVPRHHEHAAFERALSVMHVRSRV